MNNQIVLDEDTKIDILESQLSISQRWSPVTHCIDNRQAIRLLAGETLIIKQPVLIHDNSKVFFRYTAGLPQISPDGLDAEIHFYDINAKTTLKIVTLPLPGNEQDEYWRCVKMDISWLKGKEGVFLLKCLPGVDHDPTADWLAIADFCFASGDRINLAVANSHISLRIKNEIDHFSKIYQHEMYKKQQTKLSESAKGIKQTVRKFSSQQMTNVKDDQDVVNLNFEPTSEEEPYEYAMRLLVENLNETPPDFHARLDDIISKKGKVKILSLCSGAARVEAGLALNHGDKIEWSLLDINAELLTTASTQFNTDTKIDLIEANVNELAYTGEKWDIILCVSALHHLTELEKLFEFIYRSLNQGGEFWSIGESIGRNGNRLWPDAKKACDNVFGKIPEKYRLNRFTNTVDSAIPDNDYSTGCFEGIRSEEIEMFLIRWFNPVHVSKRNCFLWRLVNLTYMDNYDLTQSDDLDIIKSFVKEEIEHFKAGGLGTELNGVYQVRNI